MVLGAFFGDCGETGMSYQRHAGHTMQHHVPPERRQTRKSPRAMAVSALLLCNCGKCATGAAEQVTGPRRNSRNLLGGTTFSTLKAF